MFIDIALSERLAKNLEIFGLYEVLDDGAGQTKIQTKINNGSI